MRHTICRDLVLVLLGLICFGCAGLGVPQQPRLQASEAPFLVRPHGTFFSPSPMTLDRRPDGALALSRPSPDSPEKWAHEKVVPQGALLNQLDQALLPYFASSCEVSLDGDQ